MIAIDIDKSDDWLENFSRIGMASKGFVYLLIGGLTLFSALNMGGQISNKESVVHFLQNQPFGHVLVTILSLGLIGFVVWRGVQVIVNPENEGKGHRLAYTISGLFYGAFAVTILLQVTNVANSSGGNSGLMNQLFSSTLGKLVLVGIIVGLLIKAFFQFKKVFGKEFLKSLRQSSLKRKEKKVIKYLGYIGYTSRGIVICTIAFLFSKALLTMNPSQAGGTKEAFQLLDQSSSSSMILVGISAGLAFYGLYMFAKAKYKAMPSL